MNTIRPAESVVFTGKKEQELSACQASKDIISSRPNLLVLMTNHMLHCCHQKLSFSQEIFGSSFYKYL